MITTHTITSTMRTMFRTLTTRAVFAPLGAASYSTKRLGIAPVPSRPGPV